MSYNCHVGIVADNCFAVFGIELFGWGGVKFKSLSCIWEQFFDLDCCLIQIIVEVGPNLIYRYCNVWTKAFIYLYLLKGVVRFTGMICK